MRKRFYFSTWRIQFANDNVTKYVYTAEGEKLRTVHYTAMPNIAVEYGKKHELSQEEILSVDSTDYLLGGTAIYENGKFSKYLFGEGYIGKGTSAGNTQELSAYYFNKDHLGNIREVVDENGKVLQTINYYPFGMPYTDSPEDNSSYQKYKYNGKELDLVHGLNTYDYGARQYNPVIPSWDRVDNFYGKNYGFSPYSFCNNNPINIIDIHGDSLIMDRYSIDAIYNIMSYNPEFTMVFNNEVLVPNSIKKFAEKTNDKFIKDLYTLSIDKTFIKVNVTSTNIYIIDSDVHNEDWSTVEDYNVLNELEPMRSQLIELGYPIGNSIRGNLGQTLYPIYSNELKRSTNNNIQILINGYSTINQRSCGIAHEFAHALLYLSGMPHNHINNADFIYGRQWDVMKRFNYDFLESPSGKLFHK